MQSAEQNRRACEVVCMKQLKLCRVCGSRLDSRIRTRGRHWNCELAGWQVARDERDADSDTLTMGSVHLVSTGVRWAHCGCGGWTLAALSEGVPVAVDPPIVDEFAELTALMNGRRSFDLIRVSGRTELVYRDCVRQKNRFFPVTLEHNCGRPAKVDDPLDSFVARVKTKAADKKKKGGPERDKPIASSSEKVAALPPPF